MTEAPEFRNKCSACAAWAPLILVGGWPVCADCRDEFDADGYLMFLDNETGEMRSIEKEAD